MSTQTMSYHSNSHSPFKMKIKLNIAESSKKKESENQQSKVVNQQFSSPNPVEMTPLLEEIKNSQREIKTQLDGYQKQVISTVGQLNRHKS